MPCKTSNSRGDSHRVEPGVAESYGKALSQGVEKVRTESNEEGMKEGFPEATSEYAQRLKQDGVPGQIFINIRSCR